MTDNGNVAVLWFENGLLFHQVSPQVVRSRQALAAAVKCYCAGLVFFWALFAFVFFLRTGKKLDLGGFAETSVFCLIQIVNTALFICVLQLSLWLLRVRVKFREVATICCFALGGLFPIVSVSMSYFLYSAIGLAIEHGDPAQHYLRAAVYRGLIQQEVLSVRLEMWALALVSVAAVVVYMGNMTRVLRRVAACPNIVRVIVGVFVALCLDDLVVTNVFNLVFWKFVIREGLVP